MPVPTTVPAPRVLLRDTVYGRLLAAITDGTLAPGERLRDDELVQWLGASRTPIREALARLEQEGMVETAPNRFTRVATLSSRAAVDSFPIAAALHGLAGELAAAAEPGPDVARLRDESDRFDWALWRGDVQEAMAADAAMHDLILESIANEHLHRLVDRVMPCLRRMEWQAWPVIGRATSTMHQQLLTAMAGRDAPAAVRAARDEWLDLGGLVAEALYQAERRSSAAISSR